MKMWNKIVISDYKKKDLFYICGISSGVNFIPVDNHEHISYCTSFVKARYLLKVMFHFSVSVKSNTTFSNNPVLYWFAGMRSATESELLQDLQADRCRKGKSQLAAQHVEMTILLLRWVSHSCCPQLLTLVMMTC